MVDLASLALSALVSRRELRFDPVPEQWSPDGCGLAVASALVKASTGPAFPDSCAPVSLASLAGLLAGEGIAVAPRRLGPGELDAALDRGFRPIILHYDKPDQHWALLVGKGRWGYGVGDPARGFELLSGEELAARTSGAVILVDPSTLPEEAKARMGAALETAAKRMDLLAARAGGQASRRMGETLDAGPSPSPIPIPSPSPSAEGGEEVHDSDLPIEKDRIMGIGARLGVAENGEDLGVHAALDLRFSDPVSGLTLDYGLGVSGAETLIVLRPWVVFEGSRVEKRSFASLGLAIGDEDFGMALLSESRQEGMFRPAIQFATGLILDPLLVALSLELALPELARPWIRSRLSAVEAISEGSSLELGCAMAFGASEGDSPVSFSILVNFRAGDWRAGFGWLEGGEGRGLFLEAGTEARLD